MSFSFFIFFAFNSEVSMSAEISLFFSILDSVDCSTDGIIRRRSYRGLGLIH